MSEIFRHQRQNHDTVGLQSVEINIDMHSIMDFNLFEINIVLLYYSKLSGATVKHVFCPYKHLSAFHSESVYCGVSTWRSQLDVDVVTGEKKKSHFLCIFFMWTGRHGSTTSDSDQLNWNSIPMKNKIARNLSWVQSDGANNTLWSSMSKLTALFIHLVQPCFTVQWMTGQILNPHVWMFSPIVWQLFHFPIQSQERARH